MKVNASTLAALIIFFSATSAVPVSQEAPPPELLALKSAYAGPKTSDLVDDTPETHKLMARMPPKGPKLLTGPSDGSMSWWHYEYKRDLENLNQQVEELSKRMPPNGPKMLTGSNDGPVAKWHYEYKHATAGEGKQSAQLDKRMPPKGPKMLTGPADGSMSWWHYEYYVCAVVEYGHGRRNVASRLDWYVALQRRVHMSNE
ncbi:MAG: hypothetical protein LQ342_005304 [Letrouitia transgressa]|nr:MAG: hypothetical protein LQ342_005304 [Letrouitia transgressa]